MNFKRSTLIPTYLDGAFQIYSIQIDDDNDFQIEYLRDEQQKMPYKQLSISDRLRIETQGRDKAITYKLRIPYSPLLSVNHVAKIGEEYHRVFNTYHFENKDGFKETDVTFEEYPRAVIR